MDTPHPERILTPDELVAWFADRGVTISANRVREQMKAGSLPGYQVGGHWLTPLPWLVRWLNGLEWQPPAVAPVEDSPSEPIRFLARRRAS